MSSNKSRAFDDEMMAIALRLAERGLGATAPNPSVGAVIVDQTTGEVIARATTARGGRPHAETIAIAAAGEQSARRNDLRDARALLALWPDRPMRRCHHCGRTEAHRRGNRGSRPSRRRPRPHSLAASRHRSRSRHRRCGCAMDHARPHRPHHRTAPARDAEACT